MAIRYGRWYATPATLGFRSRDGASAQLSMLKMIHVIDCWASSYHWPAASFARYRTLTRS